MSHTTLRIGQISYLNVLPLFHHLKETFPPEGIEYIKGHPSQMNEMLTQGELDVAPASAFEYLRDAESYCLLPDLSITASHGPVKSVLLLSPVSLDELPAWLNKNPGAVNLSGASASSTALLKVMWSQFWNLPTPKWQTITPGQGLEAQRPFMEIGNHALRLYLTPPEGWHIIDLADQWKKHTGLPFVFAVWIVRMGLSQEQQELLESVYTALTHCKTTCVQAIDTIARWPKMSSWIDKEGIKDYLSTIGYDLGPQELASLTLFGKLCTRAGLIEGAPGLRWAL